MESAEKVDHLNAYLFLTLTILENVLAREKYFWTNNTILFYYYYIFWNAYIFVPNFFLFIHSLFARLQKNTYLFKKCSQAILLY